MQTKVMNKISLILLGVLNISLIGCQKSTPVYDIHTESQNEYLKGDYNHISLYASGIEELSKPNPILLEWKDFSDDSYNVYISKDKDFDVLDASYVTSNNSLEVSNLEINETYYWYASSNEKNSKIETFKIESLAPRSLNIEGLTNARDLGGYKTIDGEYTRQGLIYRTSRFNENETTTNLITEAGIKQMNEQLKIKSELDIRRVDNNENGGITQSPLGNNVNYYSIPMKSGGNCILLNVDVLKDAFEVLGNADNYPLVIHCSIGTDRTGMLCFLINALLGVGEEELYKDYLYSNFANIGGNRNPSTIKTYLNMFKFTEGDTLSQKVRNYLIGIDVKEEDIDSLIEIMK